MKQGCTIIDTGETWFPDFQISKLDFQSIFITDCRAGTIRTSHINQLKILKIEANIWGQTTANFNTNNYPLKRKNIDLVNHLV
jgi:hypothetical protein